MTESSVYKWMFKRTIADCEQEIKRLASIDPNHQRLPQVKEQLEEVKQRLASYEKHGRILMTWEEEKSDSK